MENNDEKGVSQKLQRFLLTIARRESIGRIRVAALAMKDGKVVLSKEDALPNIEVAGEEIEKAIDELAKGLCVDKDSLRYLGFFDCEKTRQYNFIVDDLPAGKFRFVALENARKVLKEDEACVLVSVLRKKARELHMTTENCRLCQKTAQIVRSQHPMHCFL